MKGAPHEHSPNCSCVSCTGARPLKRNIDGGEGVDKLNLGKNIPLKEKILLSKLTRARADYDALRNELISGSSSEKVDLRIRKPMKHPDGSDPSSAILDIIDFVDRGGALESLSECCSCCVCSSTQVEKGDHRPKRRHHRHAETVSEGRGIKEKRKRKGMSDEETVNKVESVPTPKPPAVPKEPKVKAEAESKPVVVEKQKMGGIKKALHSTASKVKSVSCTCTLKFSGLIKESKAAVKKLRKEKKTNEFEWIKEYESDRVIRRPKELSKESYDKIEEIKQKVNKKIKTGANKSLEKIKESKIKVKDKARRSLEKLKESKTKVETNINKSIEKIKVKKPPKEEVKPSPAKSVTPISKPGTESFPVDRKELAEFRARHKDIEDWACKPKICIPGKCNPKKCLEILIHKKIRKRKEPKKLKDQKTISTTSTQAGGMTTTKVGSKTKVVQQKKNIKVHKPIKISISKKHIATRPERKSRRSVTSRSTLVKKPHRHKEASPESKMSVKSTTSATTYERKRSMTDLPQKSRTVSITKKERPPHRTKKVRATHKSTVSRSTTPTSETIKLIKNAKAPQRKKKVQRTHKAHTTSKTTTDISGPVSLNKKARKPHLPEKAASPKSKSTSATSRSESVILQDRTAISHPRSVVSRPRSAVSQGTTAASHPPREMRPEPTDSRSSTQRQAVRIGSTFSFSIEFYKNKPGLRREHTDRSAQPSPSRPSRPANSERAVHKIPRPKPERKQKKKVDRSVGKKHRLKHKLSQLSASTNKSKQSTANSLRRCLCTLKLGKPNKIKAKTKPTTASAASETTRPTVKTVLSQQETFASKSVATDKKGKDLNKHRRLLPYECEPGICVPGECDPYKCIKLINKREGPHLQRHAKRSSTLNQSTKSTSSYTTTNVAPQRAKRVQSTVVTYKTEVPARKYKEENISTITKQSTLRRISSDSPNRQAVRIGSSFNFSIEFYKNRPSNASEVHVKHVHRQDLPRKAKVIERAPKAPRSHKKLQEKSSGRNSYVNAKPQQKPISMKTEKTQKNVKIGSAIIKCLCNLKLNKAVKPKKQPKVMATATKTTSYKAEPTLATVGTKTKGKRRGKDSGTSAEKVRKKTVSSTVITSATSHGVGPDTSRIKAQYTSPKHRKIRNVSESISPTQVSRPVGTPRQMHIVKKPTNRQAVKIGSSFSFNIEFYKNRPSLEERRPLQYPPSERLIQESLRKIKRSDHREKKSGHHEKQEEENHEKKKEHKAKQTDSKRRSATSHQQSQVTTVKKTDKRIDVKPLLKRCFCTLQFQGKKKQKRTAKVYTVSRVTVGETRFTAQKRLLSYEYKHSTLAREYELYRSKEIIMGNKTYLHPDSSACTKPSSNSESSIQLQNLYLPEHYYERNSFSKESSSWDKFSESNTLAQTNLSTNFSSFITFSKESNVHPESLMNNHKELQTKTPKYMKSQQNPSCCFNRSLVSGLSIFFKRCFYTMNIQMPNKYDKVKTLKLKPYECESRVCVPYQCDPKQFHKLIMKRLMKHTSRMSTISVATRSKSMHAPRKRPHIKMEKYQYTNRRPKCTVSQQAVRYPPRVVRSMPISPDKQARIGTKASLVAPKRYFCTLELQKKVKLDKKKVVPIKSMQSITKKTRNDRKTITRTQSTMTSQSRSSNKKEKFKPQTTAVGENRKRDLVKVYRLDVNECEPGVCTPGLCNPYKCLELIKQRNRRYRNRGLTTDTVGTKPARNQSDRKHNKGRHIQSDTREQKHRANTAKTKYAARSESPPSKVSSNRSAVNIGSKFSFNVEFYKDSSQNSAPSKMREVKSLPRTRHRRVTATETKSTRGASPRRDRKLHTQKSQIEAHKKHDQGTDAFNLKRCFCTLQLQKKGKHPVKDKQIKSQYTKTNRIKVVPTAHSRSVMVKEKRQNRPKLEPYECEPNVCVPGECDPIKCLERIMRRQQKEMAIGTMRPRSASKSSENSTRTRAKKIQQKPPKVVHSVATTKAPKVVKKVPGQAEKRAVASPSGSDRQSVRIGSSFSFNVEFYKDSSISNKTSAVEITPLRPIIKEVKSRPRIKKIKTKHAKTHHTKHIRNMQSQAVAKMVRNKITEVKPLLKRCFCTLKLQNRDKRSDGSKPVKKAVRNVSLAVNRKPKHQPKPKPAVNAASTQLKQKQIKVIMPPKTTKYTETRKHKARKLEPYECEPGVCTPGQCDPNKCIKRIRKRQMQTTKSGTDHKRDRSISSHTIRTAKGRGGQTKGTRHRAHDRKLQKTTKPPHINKENYLVETPRFRSNSSSLRQSVRISSSFSFDVEFFKDSALSSSPAKQKPEKQNQPKPKKTKYKSSYIHEKRIKDRGLQHNAKTDTKGVGMVTLIKRCFCTFALQKQENKPKAVYSTPKTVQSKNIATKTRKEKKVKGKEYKVTSETATVAVGSNKKLYVLKPYECEPFVCVPGKCDPYKCDKRIRKRIMKDCGTGDRPCKNKCAVTFTPKDGTFRCVDTQCDMKKKYTKTTNAQAPKPPKPSKQHRRKPHKQIKHIPKYTRSASNMHRQSVRIGSSFSCNIEFFKNKQMLGSAPAPKVYVKKEKNPKNKQKETKPKKIYTNTTGSGKIHKNCDQNLTTGVKTDTKGSGNKTALKRCFCTLKLQKKQANPVKVMRVEVQHNIHTQTKGVKPPKKKKPRKLESYECEPGYCIPGQCDPYNCLERIKKRLRKEQATSAHICDHSTKCIAAKCTPTCRQQNIQCNLKPGRRYKQQTDLPCPTKTPKLKPGVVEVPRFPNFGQGVKIGSSFSFNIEFYKETLPPSFKEKYRPEKIYQDYKVAKEPRRPKPLRAAKMVQECPAKKHAYTGHSKMVNKREFDIQANTKKENKGIDTGKILKRCFCTLKLHENTLRKQKNNYTVGRVAVVEDRRLSYLYRDEAEKVANNSIGTDTYDNYRLPPMFDSNSYSCMICNENQRINNIKHMANSDNMKIIFPYHPHKFTNNISNTLITHYNQNMEIPSLDDYCYSYPQNMAVKCQAPVAVKYSKKGNKIIKPKKNKQPIKEPEKTLFGKFKGLIRRCVQLFKNSTDKTVASKDHKQPDHIPVERKRKKKRRKQENISDSNVLKISKSDRHPKNTTIVSIPKTSKSLKEIKVSEKDKYNNKNMHVEQGIKKYSYFQSGDMGKSPMNHIQNQMKNSENRKKLAQSQKERTIENLVTPHSVLLNRNNNVMCYYNQEHYNDELIDLINRRPPFMDNKVVQLATMKNCVKDNVQSGKLPSNGYCPCTKSILRNSSMVPKEKAACAVQANIVKPKIMPPKKQKGLVCNIIPQLDMSIGSDDLKILNRVDLYDKISKLQKNKQSKCGAIYRDIETYGELTTEQLQQLHGKHRCCKCVKRRRNEKPIKQLKGQKTCVYPTPPHKSQSTVYCSHAKSMVPKQKVVCAGKIVPPKTKEIKRTCKSLSPCVCCKGEKRNLIPCKLENFLEKFGIKREKAKKDLDNTFSRNKPGTCVVECKTFNKAKKKKKKPVCDRTPLLEMRIGSDDLKILNKVDLYDKISRLQKSKKQDKSDAIYRNIELYGDLTTEQLKEIHGKSCSCCICVNRRKYEKPITLLKGQKPCVCGSKPCAKESVRIATKIYERAQAKLRKQICQCGVDKCAAEALKQDIKNKVISKKKAKKLKKTQGMTKQQLQKYKKKKAKKDREFKLRQERYKLEDDARRSRQRREDKYNEMQVYKFKDTNDTLLVAESTLDLARLGVSTVMRSLRCLWRAIFDPRSTVQSIKDTTADPQRLKTKIKGIFIDSGILSTFRRIYLRLENMRMVQIFQKKVQENNTMNFLVHSFNRDATPRLMRKKHKRRRREPIEFECSLFMASLRKRPYVAVYYICPWFYPHCVSMLGILRQFTDAMLFILAVFVWSPCILAMEICRACMCCTMCTG